MLTASILPVHLIDGAFAFIAKLAPLSILLAALSLINTVRQASAKQKEDRAQSIRRALSKAGTEAYILSWSLIGDSELAASVLHMRELIEERIGKTPTHEAILELFKDDVLIESIVKKGWHDSGTVSKYADAALEFSRLQVDLGSLIPIIHDALEAIQGELRILLISDALIYVSIRDHKEYKELLDASSNQDRNPLSLVQGKFLAEITRSSKDSFSEACKLLEASAKVTASASNQNILAVIKPPSLLFRVREHFRKSKLRSTNQAFHNKVIEKLSASFPDDAALLSEAAMQVLLERQGIAELDQQLASSLNRTTRHFLGLPGNTDFKNACETFLKGQYSKRLSVNSIMLAFVRLKCLGIADPDLDVFLSVHTGSLALLKRGLDRGANPNIGDKQVLRRHQELLDEGNDIWFIEATARQLVSD